MLTATFQDIPIPTKHQPEKCTMGRFPRVGMAPECRLRESLLIWRYWRSPWFFRGVGKNHQPVIKMPPAWPFQQDGIWRQTATERTMMLCIHRKAKLVGLVGREQGRMSFRIVHFFWFDLSGGPEILMDFAEMESGLCWHPVLVTQLSWSSHFRRCQEKSKSVTRLNTRILRHRVESLTYLSLLPEDIVT